MDHSSGSERSSVIIFITGETMQALAAGLISAIFGLDWILVWLLLRCRLTSPCGLLQNLHYFWPSTSTPFPQKFWQLSQTLSLWLWIKTQLAKRPNASWTARLRQELRSSKSMQPTMVAILPSLLWIGILRPKRQSIWTSSYLVSFLHKITTAMSQTCGTNPSPLWFATDFTLWARLPRTATLP